MPRTATATSYVYIDCPACGQGIAEPFAALNGPQTYTHRHGRHRCRIIVLPQEGVAYPVPDALSYEQAIVAAWNVSAPVHAPNAA